MFAGLSLWKFSGIYTVRRSLFSICCGKHKPRMSPLHKQVSIAKKLDFRLRGNDSVAQELIPIGIKLSFFVSCHWGLLRLLSLERFFQGERL